ncbi:MAG: hypothetical protein M9964_05860 [Solirubrobacterales bacterium]|nr:hypothetical protein [Solirubrobacterales bacterium]
MDWALVARRVREEEGQVGLARAQRLRPFTDESAIALRRVFDQLDLIGFGKPAWITLVVRDHLDGFCKALGSRPSTQLGISDLFHDRPHAVAALQDVVDADVDAVDGAERSEHPVLHPLRASVAVFGDERELPPEDLDQEVSGPAGRLEEAAIDVLRVLDRGEHVRHEVEHRVDLALMRVDLSEVSDALA